MELSERRDSCGTKISCNYVKCRQVQKGGTNYEFKTYF